MRRFSLFVVALASVALSGCMQMPLSYQPSVENLETLKASHMAPANVGTFALAPGKPASLDQTISARGSTAVPPNNSFSLFLKDALKQELVSAGKYDPKSDLVISGELTQSSLEAPISATGHGVLGARFKVDRDNQVVYDKELTESAEWYSAFMGVDAIPTALREYAALYKKLLGRLFSDKEFQQATSAK
jgi:hypothetical protein